MLLDDNWGLISQVYVMDQIQVVIVGEIRIIFMEGSY